jgi:acetylornithine/N-succinyldiaminopimelate aminotransferase
MQDIPATQLAADFIMNTYKRFSIELSSGRGACLYDARGKEYLDFLGGIAVNALGYAHPAVVRSIRESADGLIHTSNLFYTRNQGLLAKRLVEHSCLDRAFFCNSGAEANEGAIKLARKWGRGRYRIITAVNSFHGRTLATLTATGQTKYQKGFEPLVDGFDYVPYNDIGALEAAVTGDTAAVLLEPIQAEGGVIVPERGYLKQVEDLCRRHHILLMLDEVQTGIGRTGRLFAYQHFDIRPDVVTLAKALGGGFPIGCVLAGGEAAMAFAPGDHASTFGGGELVTGVALTVLDTLLNDRVIENAGKTGAYCLDKLRGLAGRHPHILHQARGLGLLIGLEIDSCYNAADVSSELLSQGLITAAAGRNVIRLAPPLIVTIPEVDRALRIIEDTFQKMGS